MTSPLYARYIPPGRISKTGNPNLGVLKKVSNPKLANPIDIQPDASATYTRYIPPSKKNGNVAEIHDSSGSHPVKAIVELKSQISSLTSTEQGKLENQSKRDTVGDVKSSLNPEESIELSQRPKKRRKAELDIKKHIIDAKDPSETEINTFHSESPQSLAKEFNKDETVKHQIKGSKSSLTDNVFEGDKRHLNLLKKREISIKKSARIVKDTLEDDEKRETPIDPDEIHDLVPLPQPEPIPESNPDPSVNLLPPWLANPIRVSPEKTVEFKEFGLNDHATKSLQAKGFTSAFAVQAAVLPLLLPGAHQDAGDIVISAATGSGKTLAYVLPMIHDISRYRVSKLRGLIILPTRELVSQAKVVIEICATAFSDSNHKRVKIGTAVGNENSKVERQTLIEQCQKYDPQGYKENLRRAELPWQDIECDLDGGYKSICDENPSRLLPDHVEDYKVKVNVLICTPGRLVEHLKSTPGFNVKDIKWLVIDEADKLLDQSFQQWLPAVLAQIESQQFDPNFKKDRVRKVVLSATMTRDLGKLAQLKLYRPRFILLKSEDKTSDHTQQYTLPSLLIESGVKVEEDSIKPLYLMELLKRESILKLPSSTEDDSSSDSESSSSSSNSSSTSNSNQSSESLVASPKVINLTESKNAETPRGVLIFTKSNETAVRLGRLITLLYPSSSSLIGILTSTLPRISRQRCLQSFARKRMSILVASDLASRGLDLPNLAHVINYDIPSSLVSYIHRVGRTARAGKKGHAWTLFSSTEGRWFWNEIGRSPNIHRPCGKVERTNIKKEALSSKQREAYEIALAKLETEANSFGLRQKAPKDYDNTLVK